VHALQLAFLVLASVVGPVVGPAAATAGPASPIDRVAEAASIREMQWHLDALRIPELHKLTKGAGVVVAVIDSGVDATHRDLSSQVLAGAGFGTQAGSDGRQDTGDGAHGTAMAGIIAAKGGGRDHALGIAPAAKILPVNIGLPDSRPQDMADAIRWAVDHGAKVLSLSFGVAGPNNERYRAPVQTAVAYAFEHDVVVVASAGNTRSKDGTLRPEADVAIPADIPGVIAVAATTRDASIEGYSVHGPEVVLAAPGTEIVTTSPLREAESGYRTTGQTSAAGAIVAGVAALIRSRYPGMDAKNVVNRLVATAKDQGAPGRDQYFGFGTIRPYEAVTSEIATVTNWPLPTLPAEATLADGGRAAGGSTPASGTRTLIVLGGVAVLAVVALVGVVLTLTLTSARRRRRGLPGPRAPLAPPASHSYRRGP
jgi:type VII secretion-associated serine protease mycosin